MDLAPGERVRDRDRAERTEKAPLRRLSLEDDLWPRECECERDLCEMTDAASSKRPILAMMGVGRAESWGSWRSVGRDYGSDGLWSSQCFFVKLVGGAQLPAHECRKELGVGRCTPYRARK